MPATAVKTKTLDPTLTRKASRKLRALYHPFRRDILMYLKEHGWTNVTTLFNHFEIEQSVMSQQLGILRRAGYVYSQRRNVKEVYYLLNEGELERVKGILKKFDK
jgi:DNA-binding transcriptional ArsR family regulator